MDERKTDNAKECTEPAEIKESREKFFSSFYDTVPCVKNESKIKEEAMILWSQDINYFIEVPK